MNTWTPDTENQEERATVVDVILSHWASGDFKFLFEDEWEEDMIQRFPGWKTEEFLNKWEQYMRVAANELEGLVGRSLFGVHWEEGP